MVSLLKRVGVLGLMAAAFMAPVRAAVFEGTFSGIAENSWLYQGGSPPGNFDGETVTGSFSLDTARLPYPESIGDDYSYTLGSGNLVSLVFHAMGQTIAFGTEPGALAAVTARPSLLRMEANVYEPYDYAWLELAGPLFDGLDPSTAHAGPIDLAGSRAAFGLVRSITSEVRLTSVDFVVSNVPEPQPWLLLLCGGIAAGIYGRHARAASRRSMGSSAPSLV